jgi:hypothetical protein
MLINKLRQTIKVTSSRTCYNNIFIKTLATKHSYKSDKIEFVKTSSRKSWYQRIGGFVKLFVVFEVALAYGSYLTWKRMNNSQEFRFYIKNTFPVVLEGI